MYGDNSSVSTVENLAVAIFYPQNNHNSQASTEVPLILPLEV
jgi:type IV secretory pathway TraG/TraD family ATPase VirD4